MGRCKGEAEIERFKSRARENGSPGGTGVGALVGPERCRKDGLTQRGGEGATRNIERKAKLCMREGRRHFKEFLH